MFDANIRLICYNVKKTNITIGLKMIILSAVCDVACLARQYVGYQPERACLGVVKDKFTKAKRFGWHYGKSCTDPKAKRL